MTRLYPIAPALGVLLLAAGVDAAVSIGRLRHRPAVEDEVALGARIPRAFGEWRDVPAAVAAVDPSLLNDDGKETNPYDDVLTRNYRNRNGREVTMVLAWRRELTQENKIHRPELCYFAQGFVLGATRRAALPGIPIPVTLFAARGAERGEAVAYWIRIAAHVSQSAWESRRTILSYGLGNRSPDGLLVRASVLVSPGASPDEVAAAEATAVRFLADLTASLPPAQRTLLTGAIA